MRKAGTTLATLVAIGSVHCGGDTGTDSGLDGPGPGAGKGSIGVAGNTAAGSGGASPGTGGGKGIGSGGTITVTGGSAGTGSSASGSGGACTGQSATGMKGQSAVVMLLVDTSLSMASPPGGGMGPGGGASKMVQTQQALNMSFGDLPNGLGIGLTFYPEVTIGMPPENLMPCFAERVAVPIAALDDAQRGLLTTAVDAAEADGSTPTHDAYVFSLAQVQASTFEGAKYVVLITDGVPTYALGCIGPGQPTTEYPNGVDTAPLAVEAGNALTANGIKTFVVGTPGSEGAREGLSAMARAGGTGPAGCSDTGPTYCHFDMTERTDLAAGLTEVLGQISAQIPVDCNFEIPPPPNSADIIDVTKTNVSYNDMPIPYDQSCTAASAWRFDDPVSPREVVFCGTLCDAVKADAMSKVDVTFGCTRVDVPR
ncbi:MAG TPA: vWA domain-containing protein [Polyangiaceae bacterium]